jgi:hypothetical protein
MISVKKSPAKPAKIPLISIIAKNARAAADVLVTPILSTLRTLINALCAWKFIVQMKIEIRTFNAKFASQISLMEFLKNVHMPVVASNASLNFPRPHARFAESAPISKDLNLIKMIHSLFKFPFIYSSLYINMHVYD